MGHSLFSGTRISHFSQAVTIFHTAYFQTVTSTSPESQPHLLHRPSASESSLPVPLICRIQLENFTRHFFNHFHTITREAERFHHLVYRCQLCSILLRPFSSTVLLLLPGAPTAIQSTSCLPDTAFFLHHR